jgi:hypothetical protein
MRVLVRGEEIQAERVTTSAAETPGGLLGLALLSASFGVQLSLTAMLLVKAPARQLTGLTQWGAYAVHTELDAPFYLAGIALGLIVAVAATRYRTNRARAASNRLYHLAGSPAIQTSAAVVGSAIYLTLFIAARAHLLGLATVPHRYSLALGLIVLATGVCVVWAAVARSVAVPEDPAMIEESPGTPEWKLSVFDVVVPIAIIVLLYVPTWRQVSGRVFLAENNLHWDLFAMGPTLTFKHGGALGTHPFSDYGAGWPMVFNALSRWIPLSYGRMIQIGSIYACIYLATVYLLLRLVVRRPAFAVFGTGLAILPFFFWMEGLYLWIVPNLTPLRWPFDVWCFIAVVAHWRSGKRLWAAIAGGFVGLALVFNINSGIELAAAFACYWLCLVWFRSSRARDVADAVLSGSVAVAVAMAGLSIASRGGIFGPQSWSQWLREPLSFLTLPLSTSVTGPTLVAFAAVFTLYLTLAAYCLARLSMRGARYFDVFNGFLALYGLLVLVKFLRHSSGMTFPRLLTPAAIILAILAGGGLDRGTQPFLRPAGGRFEKRAGLLPYLAIALIGAAIAVSGKQLVDGVLAYPNIASLVVGGSTPDGVCLMLEPRDICGLPPQTADAARGFRTIARQLHQLGASGKTTAVIDETGSLFYLASGTAPYARYNRIFRTAYTKRMIGELRDDLAQHPPDYVLTRLPLVAGTSTAAQWALFGPGPRKDSPYLDTWNGLLSVVHRGYSLEGREGPFEIWRLSASPSS